MFHLTEQFREICKNEHKESSGSTKLCDRSSLSLFSLRQLVNGEEPVTDMGNKFTVINSVKISIKQSN